MEQLPFGVFLFPLLASIVVSVVKNKNTDDRNDLSEFKISKHEELND